MKNAQGITIIETGTIAHYDYRMYVDRSINLTSKQSGRTYSFKDAAEAQVYIQNIYGNVVDLGHTVHKKEDKFPMNYGIASATINAPASDESLQRKYLENRLSEVYADKRDPLESLFGMTDDKSPKTPKELADRLAAGKFVIEGLDDEGRDVKFYSFRDVIRWRDPAMKADTAGFDAAKKDLKAKRQDALDTIKIASPADGLAALKTLEAWTPTGVAN